LINPQLDNSLAESWKASGLSGTPGYLNDIYTKAELENDLVPTDFVLYQNYPNPFNPSTKISWQSPVGSHQTLRIYNLLGSEVATLVNEYKSAGTYEVEFQSTVDNRQLASGIYYYQLKAGDFVQTKKMILLK